MKGNRIKSIMLFLNLFGINMNDRTWWTWLKKEYTFLAINQYRLHYRMKICTFGSYLPIWKVNTVKNDLMYHALTPPPLPSKTIKTSEHSKFTSKFSIHPGARPDWSFMVKFVTLDWVESFFAWLLNFGGISTSCSN